MGKQECIEYVDSDCPGDLNKHWSIIGYVFYITPSTIELALYFTVYCRFVYYGD